jgi:hypothetical protein
MFEDQSLLAYYSVRLMTNICLYILLLEKCSDIVA